MLQCVAVDCSRLQSVAVYCSRLQSVALCCSRSDVGALARALELGCLGASFAAEQLVDMRKSQFCFPQKPHAFFARVRFVPRKSHLSSSQKSVLFL